MKHARARSGARRFAMTAVAAGVATVLSASAALAAPYATQASATALHLELVGTALVVDTGAELARNDGSEETVSSSEQPLLTVLAGQQVLAAGALGEVAVAHNDGRSAACSGVAGRGGAVEVGNPAGCVTPGDAPLVLHLVDVLGIVSARIEAEAVTATCATSPDGATSGGANLAGARLVVSQPLRRDVVVDLGTEVAPNTDLFSLTSPAVAALLTPLVRVGLNVQAPLEPTKLGDGYHGGLSVTAIKVDAVGGALADVRLARVTCGPSADLAMVPAIPLAGVPVALGTLAVVGGGVAIVTRRGRHTSR